MFTHPAEQDPVLLKAFRLGLWALTHEERELLSRLTDEATAKGRFALDLITNGRIKTHVDA